MRRFQIERDPVQRAQPTTFSRRSKGNDGPNASNHGHHGHHSGRMPMRMAAARARDKMHRLFAEERRWDPIPVITLDEDGDPPRRNLPEETPLITPPTPRYVPYPF
uniref:Uncharacterized protein n=1 Tax=Steinernema glaseri TaxID=37863 RepID=A0A1I7YVF7_9BILA